MRPFTGTVAVLDQVSFIGSIDGEPDYQLPAEGSPCAGRDGYADLAPGGTVIVADGSGAALATTQLGAGRSQQVVRNTKSERDQREALIDAIYNLRVSKVSRDPVAVAQLNLDRAKLRLADLDNPGPAPQPFEGHPFQANWCVLTFETTPLPPVGTHVVTVTHRGTTTYTNGEDHVDLIVG